MATAFRFIFNLKSIFLDTARLNAQRLLYKNKFSHHVGHCLRLTSSMYTTRIVMLDRMHYVNVSVLIKFSQKYNIIVVFLP